MTHPDNDGDGHERFTELAASATAGALTSGEMSELRDHLLVCEECREVCRQYRILETEGLPMLGMRNACH